MLSSDVQGFAAAGGSADLDGTGIGQLLSSANSCSGPVSRSVLFGEGNEVLGSNEVASLN